MLPGADGTTLDNPAAIRAFQGAVTEIAGLRRLSDALTGQDGLYTLVLRDAAAGAVPAAAAGSPAEATRRC